MLPKCKTILCATDFSDRAQSAFHLACALARDTGARVVLMHVVVPPVVVYGDGLVTTLPEPDYEGLRLELNKMESPEPNVKVERLVLDGEPAPEILRQAQSLPCDLIVLGTHGRTGLNRLLLGSVAEQVMHKAPCPVLTVRDPWPPRPPANPKEHKETDLILV